MSAKFAAGDTVTIRGRDKAWKGFILRSEQVAKTVRGRKGKIEKPVEVLHWRYRVTHESTGNTEWVKESLLELVPTFIGPVQK